MQLIENKLVNQNVSRAGTRKCGGENEGFSQYVIENTGRQILKFGLAIMLLKNKRVTVMSLLCY
jgi:hypothetical protein